MSQGWKEVVSEASGQLPARNPTRRRVGAERLPHPLHPRASGAQSRVSLVVKE